MSTTIQTKEKWAVFDKQTNRRVGEDTFENKGLAEAQISKQVGESKGEGSSGSEQKESQLVPRQLLHG